MAGSSYNKSEGHSAGMITGINVTPLVDITLVLLIVFMVTAKFIIMPALPIDLPEASQSQEIQSLFAVTLPHNGVTLLNGEAAETDAIVLARARAALLEKPATRAIISADGDVPHRRVIHILDILKQAGMEHIAFGTAPFENENTSRKKP